MKTTSLKSKRKKIIFLDRDGVINKDPGGWTKHSYVTKWKDFHFLPGAKKAIKTLGDNGYGVVVISNQAGISKGFYSRERLDKITSRMIREIKKSGGKIKKVFYCVHQDSDRCDCRKPETGLLRRAEKELGVRSGGAYLIGDGRVDIDAGHKAGMKKILVLSGKTDIRDVRGWKIKPDLIFKDLLEAVEYILEGDKR